MLKKIQNAKTKTVAFVKENKDTLSMLTSAAVAVATYEVLRSKAADRSWDRAEKRFDLDEGDTLMVTRKGKFVHFRPIKDEN